LAVGFSGNGGSGNLTGGARRCKVYSWAEGLWVLDDEQ
jgi:hypothetical protein